MNKPSKKIIPAAFYCTETGTEPVREMPVCRLMGNGLFEVRSKITGKRIARILFCIHEGTMVLLHGFVKKTRKTPDTDRATALKRKREIEQ